MARSTYDVVPSAAGNCQRPRYLRDKGADVGGHWIQGGMYVRCRKCRNCRKNSTGWFVKWAIEAARWVGGYTVVLTATPCPGMGRRAGPGPESSVEQRGAVTGAPPGIDVVQRYQDLKKCVERFEKRLRHVAKWTGKVKVLEEKKKNQEKEFPHFMLVFFGWPFVPLRVINAMWCSVVFDTLGLVVPMGQGMHVGEAVPPGGLDRAAPDYFTKEMSELGTYAVKETRADWMPPRARRWTKTPRLPVYMDGKRAWHGDRYRESRLRSDRAGPPAPLPAASEREAQTALFLVDGPRTRSAAFALGP